MVIIWIFPWAQYILIAHVVWPLIQNPTSPLHSCRITAAKKSMKVTCVPLTLIGSSLEVPVFVQHNLSDKTQHSLHCATTSWQTVGYGQSGRKRHLRSQLSLSDVKCWIANRAVGSLYKSWTKAQVVKNLISNSKIFIQAQCIVLKHWIIDLFNNKIVSTKHPNLSQRIILRLEQHAHC